MSEIKWIKITTNMFDDDKIRLIEAMPEKDTIYYIWIRLLVMAGKTNNQGQLYVSENMPYTEDMLCTIFNRPKMIVSMALSTFRSLGMIQFLDNGHLHITNWSKHQSIEGLDKIREQNRIRQSKYKENLRLASSVTNVTNTLPSISISNSNLISSDSIKTKKNYAEFVKITDVEYGKLVEQFGQAGADSRIENINLYKGSTGKKYASDYLTILNWERKNKKSDTSAKKTKEEFKI